MDYYYNINKEQEEIREMCHKFIGKRLSHLLTVVGGTGFDVEQAGIVVERFKIRDEIADVLFFSSEDESICLTFDEVREMVSSDMNKTKGFNGDVLHFGHRHFENDEQGNDPIDIAIGRQDGDVIRLFRLEKI